MEFASHNQTNKKWRFEGPTWCVIGLIYGGWIVTVSCFQQIPGWISYPVLIFLTAWFMSLQHEVLHGHPTPWQGFNRLLVLFPISPWFPYDLYRDSHLIHHRDEHLTLPGLDPESNFVSADVFNRLPAWKQSLRWWMRTLLGRSLVGTLTAVWEVWGGTLGQVLRGQTRYLWTWVIHLVLLGVLLMVLKQTAGISALHWLGGICFPALCLIMFRSFYEHRAATLPAHRIVINEASWPWRLLFLNNNYHAVHHDKPGLPWYQISGVYRSDREGYLARNGGFLIQGYWTLIKTYWRNPVDTPLHPFASPAATPTTCANNGRST